MGITVKELINNPFFKEWKVIAGKKGVNKQIQGIGILDSPDGLNYILGKELALSTGYVYKENPDLMRNNLKSKQVSKMSGIGIKFGRYIDIFPQDILDKFDEIEVPLIKIPKEHSWMYIMNQINVIVMNNNIRRFQIEVKDIRNILEIPFQTKKINNILYNIEKEMEFPAMVYLNFIEKTYQSSENFKLLSESLEYEDFWDPKFEHTKEILCASLKITRYRVKKEETKVPFSWITIPITVGGIVEGYLVVLEAFGLIDYFDEFALRTGFLLIQSVGEQMIITRNINKKNFDDFIINIISGRLTTKEEIRSKAVDISININKKYIISTVKNNSEKIKICGFTNEAYKAIKDINTGETYISFIKENSGIILYETDNNISNEENIEKFKKILEKLERKIQKNTEKLELEFGISDVFFDIEDLERNYKRAKKAEEIGSIFFSRENKHIYSFLGALVWMDIENDEIDIMAKDLKKIYKKENCEELIETLKVYLESNMNYSETSKKMYTHINTVRKRINTIVEEIGLNIEDYNTRLKLGLIIKIFK